MSVSIVLGALMLAQAGPAVQFEVPEGDRRDVAYEQIAAGETSAAIAALEQARATSPDDPALLINLGAAYTEAGDLDRAEECYRTAMHSEVRYRLELASGEWMDSRWAAREALAALEERRLAMR